MIPAFGIGAAALAVAASAALVVVSTAPLPAKYTAPVWIDQPIAGQTLEFTQDFFIKLHASAKSTVSEFRITFTHEGKADGSAVSDGATNTALIPQHVLANGTVHWDPKDPGHYTLTPAFLAGGTWTTGLPISVDVINNPPAVTVPAPTDTPTPTPSPTIVLPTVPPVAPAPPKPPAPTTSATPTSTPAPAPTAGTIHRRANGQNDLLTAQGFTPVNASVDIQYQISLTGAAANPGGSWSSLGCGSTSTNGGSNYCQVNPHFAQTSQTQTVHLRVVVTFGAQKATAYGDTWVITPLIH